MIQRRRIVHRPGCRSCTVDHRLRAAGATCGITNRWPCW